MPGKRRRDYERSATVWSGTGAVMPWQSVSSSLPSREWTADEVPLAGTLSIGLFLNRACEFSRTLLE